MQKSIKILLLEDELNYTDILTMGLQQEGFESEIVEVATKKGFVDQLKGSSFDVIISDYTLPDINGMEAVQIAVELVPDTPVVVFTGSVGEETAIACLKAGAVDYVLKQNPTRLVSSLLKAVDAALARKDRKNAERALKESEQKFKAQFDGIPLPTYTWQHRGDQFVLVGHNAAADRATRQGVRKFVGRTAAEMYADRPDILKDFEQCLSRKEVVHREMSYRFRSSGEEREIAVDYVFVPPDFVMVHTEDITERKRAEHELQKLSRVVEQTDDIVFITNTDGVIEYVNPAFEKTTGYKREEVIGNTPRILKSGKHPASFYQQMWKTILDGVPFRGILLNKKKDGTTFFEEKTITPLGAESGAVTHFVSTGKDVTERMKTIELLRQNEEKQRLVLTNMHEIVYMVREKNGNVFSGTVEFVNDRVEAILGYTANDFTTNPRLWLDSIHPDDIALMQNSTERLLMEKKALTRHYRIKHKHTGEFRWMADHAVPQFAIGDKKVVGIFGVARDITDRKRAEERLLESEDRFRNLVENITDVFYVSDPDGKLIYGSPNLFSESGYAPHEIIGESYLRLVAPVDRRRVVDFYAAQTSAGVLDAACELRAVRKDGAILWTEQRTRIVRDGAGKIIEYRNVVRNVTERKLAEETRKRAAEALHESEKKYRQLVENLSDVIYEFNPRAEITFVNPAIRRVLGYEPDELVGKSVFDLIYPADRDVLLKRLGELKQGIEFPLEYRVMTKSGDIRWIRTWSKPIKEGNTFLGARGTLVDITERKLAEEALQKSETRFRTLFEQAGVGVAVIETGTGRFAEINEKYCDILGYTKEEMLWTTFQAVTYSDDLQADLDNMELLREGAIRTFSMEKRYLHKSGRIVWVNLTVSPLWKTGRPIDFHVAVVEDITASKQAQEIARIYAKRLQALSKQLLEIQENERSMIARELHDEIGQSLTRLKILLEMDKRGKAGDAGQNLREAAELAGSLISRVRDLSLDLRPPMLDDLGLVPAIRSHFLHHTEKMGIDTHFIAEPEEMHFSSEIEMTCFRVAQEAVTNALRYSRAKSIAVQLKRCETSLELSIRDDGTGFDVETAFRQSAEGKSFGLLGMQERVRLAGGIFTIDSGGGHGSEVHAKFPNVFPVSVEGSERHAVK